MSTNWDEVETGEVTDRPEPTPMDSSPSSNPDAVDVSNEFKEEMDSRDEDEEVDDPGFFIEVETRITIHTPTDGEYMTKDVRRTTAAGSHLVHDATLTLATGQGLALMRAVRARFGR